ncbi:TonB-dependent siderophore receptor protein [Leptolyngbya sp. NIES-3755]|nr:TonB-dependent siderophore receptor protein [Leptolyngbya sp. NIES-3755]
MQVQRWVWLWSVLSVLIVPCFKTEAAKAEGEQQLSHGTAPVSQINPRPATTVKEWMAQVQAATVQVTAVTLNPVDTGLEILLQTADARPLSIDSSRFRSQGNQLIAEIPNAVLTLPQGFRAENPTADVAQVQVVQQDANTLRVIVTGNNALPQQDVRLRTGTFVYSLKPEVDEPDEEIVVTGEEQGGYLAPNASTATRTDTPIRDTPQSIQVIPRQIIEDKQAIGVEEVLENAASVTFLGNQDGRGLNFAIRGFENAPISRDGFFYRFGPDLAEPEVANLERVEVLRGPASVLYGQAEPGGVINLVTKQPLSDPFYQLQFQTGNRGLISPSIDLSGPLTDDKRVLYRLNALYRREDSFRDFENNLDRIFVAPTLTWKLNDQTDLTLNVEYTKDREPLNFGTIAFGEGIANIPPERIVNTNPDNTIEQDFLNVGYTLEHRFNPNWRLRNQLRYNASNYEISVLPIPFSLDESTGILDRAFAAQSGKTDAFFLYTNVQGKFNTGSIKHTLLFGVDLTRAESAGETRVGFDPEFASPINIFAPDYSATPTPLRASIPVFIDIDTTTEQLGVYLQNQIELLDNLIVVAGLRYDTVTQKTIDNLESSEFRQSYSAFTPRIGIVYQPIEPISLYANYSRSFAPNLSDVESAGTPLEPEEGEGIEVGVRADIIRNRLAATLAFFNITKQNVATTDPNNPFLSIATGEQRSRGIDFSLTGQILPGWNLVASYAYIDAKVTEDNTDIVGNRLIGVPQHSASLWTTYEVQSGNLRGLGFGLGFNFVGERQGDLDNSFRADSYGSVSPSEEKNENKGNRFLKRFPR